MHLLLLCTAGITAALISAVTITAAGDGGRGSSSCCILLLCSAATSAAGACCSIRPLLLHCAWPQLLLQRIGNVQQHVYAVLQVAAAAVAAEELGLCEAQPAEPSKITRQANS
jgi:hypothetical protein